MICLIIANKGQLKGKNYFSKFRPDQILLLNDEAAAGPYILSDSPSTMMKTYLDRALAPNLANNPLKTLIHSSLDFSYPIQEA